MTESLSAIPAGIRYYFGSEAQLRRRIEQTAMTIFDGWSYEEMITPTVDYYSLFERGMGVDEAQRAFRFTDVDGRMLALRRDVTSGIARAVATLMGMRDRPLRFCYAAPVFRLRPGSHAEWRRESTQIGCELIGCNSTAADLEVVLIASEILSSLGMNGKYTITCNDMEIFNGIAESRNLDSHSREEMRQLVDAHNPSDLERFLLRYTFPAEAHTLAQLFQLSSKHELFGEARRALSNSQSLGAVNRLEILSRSIDSLGLSDRFEIDLGDVSRLDYYTGLVFKIYVAGAGCRIGSGGRYDRLTANFGKAEPAIGFVLDLDTLVETLLAKGNIDAPNKQKLQVLSSTNQDETATRFKEALKLRARGERIAISLGEKTSCQS